MRAARIHAPGDIRHELAPDPVAAPGHVVVRVRAVSVCPSDWRLFADGHTAGALPRGPIIPGHEFAGDVIALGEGVSAFRPGDRVAVDPTWPCGECDMCREGQVHICRRIVFASFPPQDGAMAEMIACPAPRMQGIPPGVAYEEAALAEPLGVALHAVRMAPDLAGRRAVVLGAGLIGIGVLLAARARGAEVQMVEPVDDRRPYALAKGALAVHESAAAALAAGVEGHVVFECSGSAEGMDDALRLCRPSGAVVVVGIPRDDRVTFDISTARRREITVAFSRRSRDTLSSCLSMMATGELNLTDMPRWRFPLERAQAAMTLTATVGRSLRAYVLP